MFQRTLTYRHSTGWDGTLPIELDSTQTLVLAFGAPEFGSRPQAFEDLAAAFPKSVLVGCSTAGEVMGPQVHDQTVSVAVARFERTRLKLARAQATRADESFTAGTQLATQLAGPDLRAVFVLSDGLCVNGTALVAGLAQHLAPGVVITGGLAGDGSAFRSTWVLDGATPRSNTLCAVGFYGEHVQVGHGSAGGWSVFGPERRITRSQGNVLFELDGKPALDLYKSYLGELAAGLPGNALLFPLQVRRGVGEPLVRTILALDEEARSMTFAGDMPEGASAWLMRASNDALIDSAGDAAGHAAQGLAPGQDDCLVVSVSCVGRRLVLGERTDEELETVAAAAPRGAGHVGFYSYGEISPALGQGASELHNQTMTVTLLSERRAAA